MLEKIRRLPGYGSLVRLKAEATRRWRAGAWAANDSRARMDAWNHIRQKQLPAGTSECLRALDPTADVTSNLLAHFLQEIRDNKELANLCEKYDELTPKNFEERLTGRAMGANVLLYGAIRLRKPSLVVETGCAAGWTTALILQALSINGSGELFTIDLPPEKGERSMDWTLPNGLEPGFLVPAGLKERWSLIIGNARTELVPLLEGLDAIDLFYHDSDHTYNHMMWEYTTAWSYLDRQGLLVSDDIGWNTAFWDFVTAQEREPIIHRSNPNFGALLRSPSEDS